MGSDEYSTAVGGGLKLKGSKPSGIEKKKKKKKKTAATSTSGKTDEATPDVEDETTAAAGAITANQDSGAVRADISEDELRRLEERAYDANASSEGFDGKTPTERRHEEMKRKRLSERLLRTGAKTHKQRVEELNKYLSNLSEHHDMPRIGPG